jgi:hypothetical protein
MYNPLEMGISAVWRQRPITVDAGAELLVELYRRLAPFGRPFDRLLIPSAPGEPPAIWSGGLQQARELLLAGRSRDDVRGQIIPELGFQTSLAEDRRGFWKAGVGVNLGATAASASNSVGISLPPGTARDATTVGILERLLGVAIDVFHPDWAVISSVPVVELLRKRLGVGEPSLGWYTFLSERELAERIPLPKLPEPTMVTSEDGGVLITLTREWLDPSNPSHRALIQNIDGILCASGFVKAATPGAIAN